MANKQTIRNAVYRLGMHATAKAVVHALAQQGVQVDEQFVRLVRIELLKETTGAKVAKVFSPAPSPGVRRCPKGFPRRRGYG